MDSKIIIVSFLVGLSMGVGTIPDVSDFFPEIEDDLTRITWGHGINSEALIDEALTNDLYMMLEADVSKGHLANDTSPSKLIPIMAHPPHKTSDISFETWIDKVISANEKGKKVGVKLDFKDLDIVINCLEILRKKSSALTFPLWLNANILQGPGGAENATVDADIFLSLCTEFFPDATLSLGWTTGTVPGQDLKYTTEMVEEMVDTLDRNNVNQPVTFPIRAAFVGDSFETLETLYVDKPDATFTIWTSATDNVDPKSLAKFLHVIGGNNVYFDLPEHQMAQVEENLAKVVETTSPTSKCRSIFQPYVLLSTVVLCIIVSILGAQFFT